MNTLTRSGIYPSQFKLAKVCPIYKKGDANNPNNYRPIAVLPIISKIMDRHQHNEITSYLVRFKLLSDSQSGFRARHSCETLLIKLTNNFLENMDKGNINTALMLDLSKAFDLISHPVLLKKLECYNFENTSMKLLHSFLDERGQIYLEGNTRENAIIKPLVFPKEQFSAHFYLRSI